MTVEGRLVFFYPLCLDPSQAEPVKLVRPQRKQVRQVADTRKQIIAKHLDQDISFVAPQIQFNGLRSTRKIVDNQDGFAVQLPKISQYSVVGWIQKLDRPPAKHFRRFADRYDALHPMQQRVFTFSLRNDIHGGITE